MASAMGMKGPWRVLNLTLYGAIATFLGLEVVTATASKYAWALTCYECKACVGPCPVEYDPSYFVAAAWTDNPNLYMPANGFEAPARELAEIDGEMTVVVDGRKMSAAKAVNKFGGGKIVKTHMMKVKDAAKLCVLCRACEKVCPIRLRITDPIEDMRGDGVLG